MDFLKILFIFGFLSTSAAMDFLKGDSLNSMLPSLRRTLKDQSDVFMDGAIATSVPMAESLQSGFKVVTNPVPDKSESGQTPAIVEGMVVKGTDGILRLLRPMG